MSHQPVLLQEMLRVLSPKSGETYIDGTFGGGGYTRAILESADCRIIAIDRDPDASCRAHVLQQEFGDRFRFVQGNFGNLESLLPLQKYDGLVLDFGVSSYQLDEAPRGFSFRLDGPLDMRMSHEGNITAAIVVNTYSASSIAQILWLLGEEKKSRAIARSIEKHRQKCPFRTTGELAELVRSIVRRKDGIDPATRTFQALRIFVNNELIEIDNVLKSSLKVLSIGARVVAVAFHSLEDRLVKNEMRVSFPFSSAVIESGRFLSPLFSKPISPSEDELRINPRSRSAKLRGAVVSSLKERVL